jgi:hypothetical protein
MYTETLPPRSNRATWDDSLQCFEDEQGTPLDISTATEIIVEIADCGCSVLSAKLSAGQILLGGTTGVFSFVFSATQMGSLCAKTYDFNVLVTVNGETLQAVAAQLPVINGRDR